MRAERHGYAIVQDIAERSSARRQLEPGNLYRTLWFMFNEGLIEESDRLPAPEVDDPPKIQRSTSRPRSAPRSQPSGVPDACREGATR